VANPARTISESVEESLLLLLWLWLLSAFVGDASDVMVMVMRS